MSRLNDFRIEMDRKSGCQVFLNGTKLQNVKSVKFEADTDCVAMVTVELYATTLNAAGDADVKQSGVVDA